MSRYTLEISELLKDPNFSLFNFDYDFYLEENKSNFESKFIDHYYFDEIGFETVVRFKQRLRSKLNEIAPYYKQLYKTELECEGINFLLNKDLTETTTRELSGMNDSTKTAESILNGTESMDYTNTYDSTENYKESNLDNGNADVTLSGNNLTNINSNENNNNTKYNSDRELNNTNNINSEENDIRTETETITLTSKGNIGTTSSAKLLEEYRNVLLNIDMLIIEECKDLFMGVY